MAERSKTVHVVELNANAKHLQEALTSLKKSFGSMVLPPDLEKTFVKLENALGSVLRKTEKGIIPREDFQDTERELTKVKNGFDALSGSIESIKKASDKKLLSMLPEDTATKLGEAKKAYEIYAGTLATVVAAEKALADAREKLKATEDRVTGATNSERVYKGKVTLAEKELAKYQEITDALKEQADATKALADAQEELEKARSSGKGEKAIAKRQAIVDEATSRKATADTKVGSFSKKDLKAQKDATDKLSLANEKLEAAQKASESATKAKTAAEVAAQTASNNLSRAQNKSAEDAQKEAQALAKLKSALEAVDPKYKNITIEGETAGEQLANLREIVEGLSSDELAKLKVSLGQVDKSLEDTGESLEDTKDAFQQTKKAVKESDEALAQREAFENKIKQFLGLSGAAQLLRSALRDAMQTITELDATMTEMAVVTDLTVGDYWNQLPEYSKQASNLGVSINSAYKAATLYYQQGLKGNEVTKISAETLKMAKIAGLDAADATNKMTAALRGFNMELNETSAQRVSDVYSELAAITAADVDEISNAMTKTASIAHSAGMEFETTAAFLSQIIETTRESAETAGTALKTVIARFQELKKDPAEIGEVDGEIVDANKIETALRSVGVALRDSSGQFRELDDVFLELSGKWDGLDKNTQRYIATIAAGSRQQSRFIAMMSDYGRTQELVTAANNSAGASQRQFEKTLEGVEAKLEKLKNAWHEFTMGIMNSDLVKTGIDILTKFLEILNKMTDGIGEKGFGGGLMKLFTIFGVFKMGMAIFKKFEAPLSRFFQKIVEMAGVAGHDSGKKFTEEAKKGSQEATQTQETLPEGYKRNKAGRLYKAETGQFVSKEEEKKLLTKEDPTIGKKILDKTGVTKFKEGTKQLSEIRAGRKEISSKKKEIEQLESSKQFAIDAGDSAEEIAKADEEILKAKEDLTKLESQQVELEKTGSKAWQSIGQGIGQAGQALAGVGMGMSAVGGILSSLGLEEAGEVISSIGQGITMVGGALMAIPPILTLISSHPILLIIVAVLTVIITLMTIIINLAKKASPEAKLDEARKAADAAADAADRAAESYENLKNSLDSLSTKYDALDNLTRGTKEWNESVQDINNSVLDLIDKYPELSKFVENKEGVLTLDVESDEVQKVLNEAAASKVMSKNASIMANAEVKRAENRVAYKELSDDAKFNSANGAYAAAMGGSIAAGAGVGAGVGAAAGGIAGTVIPGAGNVIGAGGGAIIGSIIGAIGGVIGGFAAGEAAKAAAQEKDRDDTDALAKALASGEIMSNEKSIADYLTNTLNYTAEEAKELASRFAENADELRSYGEGLVATDAQQQAAYDAIAASAQSLANTLTMTEEQIKQSSVVADGDLSEKYYQEMMANLEDEDFTEKNYDGEYKNQLENAIKSQYGESAKLGENGQITYNDGTEDKTITLTNDQLKAMVATQYATEQTATAIEYSDDAIGKIGSVVGADAVSALYSANEGKALTQADLKTIQGTTTKQFQDIWSSLTDDEKKVYGNDINELIKDFQEGANFAKTAFEKAGDAARDFMTADMAVSFKNKLDEVAELAGGEKARKAVQDKTDELLAGKDAQVQQAIQSRINATDWSNLEQLLALQLDLELQYGYTTEQAKAYVDSLGDAAFATSSLDTTVKTYGELWKATEKINQSMTRLNELQWQYNRAISGQGDIVEGLLDDILEEYKTQAKEYERAYRESNTDIARIYAQGGTQYGVDLRKAVTLGKDGIDVDKTRIDEFVAAGQISQEDADKWINKLTEQYKTSEAQLEGLRGVLENIEELEQQGQDAYYQLRDMVKEAVVASLQEQIDLQQQTLDANREANSQLINKIQEQINNDRQLRENQETEQNIADLRNQYAYMSMDTSNVNSLELQNLDKSIADAEQNYQDTLVDQTIQSLQDANAKAEAQRERQISLAESQLDAYQQSNQFQEDIDAQLEDLLAGGIDWQSSNIGQLLTEHFTEGMGTSESDGWAKEIGGAVGAANDWLNTKWGQETQNINNYLEAIAAEEGAKVENLVGEAASRKISSQYKTLTGSGFSGLLQQSGFTATKDENGKTTITQTKNGQKVALDEGLLNDLSNVQKMDSDSGKIGDLTTKIANNKKRAEEHGETAQASKFDILTKEEFYNTYNASSKTFSGNEGGKYTSYTDYLTKKSNQVLTGIDNLSAIEAYGGIAVPGELRNMGKNNWKDNDVVGLDVKIEGTDWDNKVRASGKVTGDVADKLDIINAQTGKTGSGIVITKAGWPISGYGGTDNSGGYNLWIKSPYESGVWKWVKNENSEDVPARLTQAAIKYHDAQPKNYTKYKYKTGGLADFTGPAWLDGTKSRPEYVLNAAQTERFFSLVDVLEGYDKDKKPEKSGDNYFEIEINVEKLESDYDVEQVANKIRKMIYEDAMYRNVNAINNMR